MSSRVYRVLLIRSEPWTVSLIKELEKNNYSVQQTEFQRLSLVQAFRPDLVLLDLDDPTIDGAQTVGELRSLSKAPVIVLSIPNQKGQVIELLGAGADDFLTRPFGFKELLARMKVALRGKPTDQDSSVFCYGDLALDFGKRQVFVRDSLMRLPPLEYAILSILARNHGKTVWYARLLQEFWGDTGYIRAKSLRVHLARLRRKVELDPKHPEFLFTEPGVGYRLGVG